MIILILLYLSISSALAVPTGHPPLPPAISNFQSIFSRDTVASSPSESSTGNTRTIWNIIWSCFSTIFACVWVAVHPNIPDPKDSQWKILRRRMMIMAYVLLAPEMVIFWAARQNRDAMLLKIAFQIEGHPDWTKTHAFFLIMGGFTLYAEGKPLRVLEWTDFKALVRSGAINWPDITEEEIKDKSKGDSLSKSIAVLQSIWFYVQFMARSVSGLTITELEVATLVYSILPWGIYGFWWDKPLNVRFSVPVHLVEQTTGQDISDNLTEAPSGDQIGTDNLSPSYPPNLPSSRPTLQNSGSNFVPTMIMHPSQEQLIEVDRPRGPTTNVNRKGFYLLRYCCRECGIFIRLNLVRVFSVFSFANQIKDMLFKCTLKTDTRKPNDHPSNPLHNGPLSVPTFYSYTAGLWHLLIVTFLLCFISAFMNVSAWFFDFSTSPERWAWKITIIIISLAPLMMIFSFLMKDSGAKIVDKPIFNLCYNVLCWVYITGRMVFLLIPLISLWALPPGAYIEFEWASIFPHI